MYAIDGNTCETNFNEIPLNINYHPIPIVNTGIFWKSIFAKEVNALMANVIQKFWSRMSELENMQKNPNLL